MANERHGAVKIRLRQAEMSYRTRNGSVLALQNVNLDIHEGEFVCLVGVSGCGKTTLLNLVAGYLQPTSGSVTLDGAPINGPGPDRAVIFQADAVFPWLTVRQNVEYGLRVRRVAPPERARITEHYVALVGLQDAANRYPKELSGGMRKRVDIARAYANEPEVMLMDEPFGMLDAITKERMQLELAQLLTVERKTILFVTHDLEEAVFLGDRVVVLATDPGRIAAIVEVHFGHPRSLEIKQTPEFQRLRTEMRRHLGDLAANGAVEIGER